MAIIGAGSGGDEEHLLLFDESGELVIDLAVYFSHFYSPLLDYISLQSRFEMGKL